MCLIKDVQKMTFKLRWLLDGLKIDFAIKMLCLENCPFNNRIVKCRLYCFDLQTFSCSTLVSKLLVCQCYFIDEDPCRIGVVLLFCKEIF